VKNFKVKWDCRDEDCTEPVVSVVSYDRVSADRRASLLKEAGRAGVEVFEAPIGVDTGVAHVGHVYSA
jgi:hypothetical protein